jgi:cyclophilin family peptidyl-prolyl cis-trans isomerase
MRSTGWFVAENAGDSLGKAAKRARQKENRQRLEQARVTELRRRNLIRLVVLVVVLALVAGGAVAASLTVASDETGPDSSQEGESSGDGMPTVACNGKAPPRASPKQYDSPPPMQIDPDAPYTAVMATSCGSLEMELLPRGAPENVNNFVFLAEQGFYDGLLFHRVEQDSVIQAGDPDGINGREPDGPGYTVDDEPPDSGRVYVFGTVAMANAGPDTAGSQFFIVVHDFRDALAGRRPEPAGFRPEYSVIGKVKRSSWDVLQRIASRPTKESADPDQAAMSVQPVYIESIEVRRS